MGDVLLATSILPPLKERYPHAEIHFLAGSWAAALVGDNRSVDRLITYDSIAHSRTGSLLRRMWVGLKDLFTVRRRLKREGYDLGLVLRAYPFNSIPLMFMGGVKYRVGFSAGGFGFLLDRIVPYRTGVHDMDRLKDLLNEIGVPLEKKSLSLSFVAPETDKKMGRDLLKNSGVKSGERFVLIHTGSDNHRKRWNIKDWQKVVDSIAKRWGIKVLAYDEGNMLKRCLKLPPEIPLGAFAGVMEESTLVVGHDSFPVHLAAAVGVPAVVIWCGINDHIQRSPVGDGIWLVRKDLVCSPCWRKEGCETMDCMDISAGEVMRGVEVLMLNRGVVNETMVSLARRGTCFGYAR